MALIDDNGILNIKRYHKASTVIGGADILVTCDQCGSSVVFQVRRPQPKPKNIIGTIVYGETDIKYFFS